MDDNLIFGVVIGLLMGWNFLPQPAWVRSLFEKFKLIQKYSDETPKEDDSANT